MDAIVHVMTLFIVGAEARNVQQDPTFQTPLPFASIPSPVLPCSHGAFSCPKRVCVCECVCLGGGGGFGSLFIPASQLTREVMLVLAHWLRCLLSSFTCRSLDDGERWCVTLRRDDGDSGDCYANWTIVPVRMSKEEITMAERSGGGGVPEADVEEYVSKCLVFTQLLKHQC